MKNVFLVNAPAILLAPERYSICICDFPGVFINAEKSCIKITKLNM